MRALTTLLSAYFAARCARRFKSREALDAWQDRQVQAFLAQILPRSPFYRRHVAPFGIAEWQRFPLVDKALMMAHFDEFNTVGLSKEEAFAVALKAEATRDFAPTLNGVTVGLSSGTSGSRGLFLASDRERSVWAGTILARVLPRSLFARHRLAFFMRANSNLYTTVKSRRLAFEFFDLLEPFGAHVARLNAYQPTCLIGPPSMLRMLAEAASKGALRIAPEKVVSVAEVLDPLDEALIARAFGPIVHQVYQCTEGFLGATCRYGTLHLNEDVVVVQKEWVDEARGKFVPLITDFRRTSQPIVRYRLNDLLTERAEPCPCGSVFTALASIEGRCDDVFYVPSLSGDRLVPVFPDFLRRALIAASDAIAEYTLVQHAPDALSVSLRAPEAARPLVVQALFELFERLECAMPHVTFTPYAPPQKGRKLRRVERRFAWPADGSGAPLESGHGSF